MRRAAAALWGAWSFLTILPPAFPRALAAEELAWTLACFPLAGAAIGGVAGLAVLIVARFAPQPLVAVVAVAVPLAVTGALHFDGLLDTADGAFAPRDPERRREIMQDSRVGAFAVVTGGVTLLTFFACALSLDPWRLATALIVAGAAGRAAAVLAVARYPYGREAGLGKGFRAHVVPAPVVVGVSLAVSISLVAGWRGLGAALAAIAVGLVLAGVVARRLGGSLTGDAYGFCEQFAELAVLVAFTVR